MLDLQFTNLNQANIIESRFALPGFSYRPVFEPVEENFHGDEERKFKFIDTLFYRLATLREKIASEQKVQARIVFHDSTLKNMCRYLPTDLDSFRLIPGVVDTKIEKYGSKFANLICSYIEENGGDQFGYSNFSCIKG